MCFLRIPLLIALGLSLTACGQKGPLILPDARTKAPVPVTAPANPDAKKNNKDDSASAHRP